MELKTYLTILARRWRIVLLVALVVTGIFTYGGKNLPPSYQAETRLRVITPVAGSLRDTYHEVYFASRLVTTYAQVATSEQIMLELKEKLKLEALPEISVKVIPDSEIIQIIVVSSDRMLAADAANGLAELIISKQDKVLDSSPAAGDADILTDQQNVLLEKIAKATEEHDRLVRLHSQTLAQIAVMNRESRQLETLYFELFQRQRQTEMQEVAEKMEALDLQYEKLSVDANVYSEQILMLRQRIDNDQRTYSDLTYGSRPKRTRDIIVISPAVVPPASSSPGSVFLAGLGLICGLIVGVVSAFVFDSLDARIFSFEQIGHIKIASLGQFPKLPTRKNRAHKYPNFESAALYRDYWMVCTRIQSFLQGGTTKTILVTSPNPMEGKSTFVSSIAMGLARNAIKVLIVDADLRRPQQQNIHPISVEQGLSDFLKNKNVKFEDVIQKDVMPDVDLLPNLNEYEGTGAFKSPRFAALLQETKKYDVVLFDSPALLSVPTTYSLVQNVDGVVVLSQWGRTTINDIQSACSYLEDLGPKLLGVVLSQVPARKEQNYYSRHKAKGWFRFIS